MIKRNAVGRDIVEMTKADLLYHVYRGAWMSPVSWLVFCMLYQITFHAVNGAAFMREIDNNPYWYTTADGGSRQCRYCLRADVERSHFQEQCSEKNHVFDMKFKDIRYDDSNVSNILGCSTGRVPTCEPGPFPNHTRLIFSHPTREYHMNTRLTVTCEDGYHANQPDPVLLCQVDTPTWNASFPLSFKCVPTVISRNDTPTLSKPSDMSENEADETWIYIVIGAAVVFLVIVLLFVCVFCIRCHRNWSCVVNLIKCQSASCMSCVKSGNKEKFSDEDSSRASTGTSSQSLKGEEAPLVEKTPVSTAPPSYIETDSDIKIDISPLDQLAEGGAVMVTASPAEEIVLCFVLPIFKDGKCFTVSSRNSCQLENLQPQDSGRYCCLVQATGERSVQRTFELTISSQDMTAIYREEPEGQSNDTGGETTLKLRYDHDHHVTHEEETNPKVLLNSKGSNTEFSGVAEGLTMHQDLYTQEPAVLDLKADPEKLSRTGGDMYNSREGHTAQDLDRLHNLPDNQETCTALLEDLETYASGDVLLKVIEIMDPDDHYGPKKSWVGLSKHKLGLSLKNINFIRSKLGPSMCFGPTAHVINLMVQKGYRMGHLVHFLGAQDMRALVEIILHHHTGCPFCNQIYKSIKCSHLHYGGHPSSSHRMSPL